MSPDDLHDIVEPVAVSWAPQTLGWFVLAAVVLVVAARWGWLRFRRWQADAYRRTALRELEQLRAAAGPDASAPMLAKLPALVKRAALSAAPRGEIASLSGHAWLTWLDRSYSAPAFTSGPGRILPDLAYARPATLEPADVEALLVLVEDWLRTHRVPAPGDA